MQLQSPLYLLFLLVALLTFVASPRKWRWAVLLVASLLFYASLGQPHLLLLLALVSGTSYLAGLAIDAYRTRATPILWTGIALTLLFLSLSRFPAAPIPFRSSPFDRAGAVVIAVGVSFYAFQAISYLADVYRRTAPPERHLGRFCLYLSFFPKLLQGPIERGGRLLPQLRDLQGPQYSDLRLGALLMTWGVFKKAVVADRLGRYVDPVYAHVHDYTGLALLVATVLFAFQLYADFSGYTDIAVGSARLFGVRLSPNFDNPYASASIAEFWRRWHITLSSWLRDYLFTPLTSWLSRRVRARSFPMLDTDLFLYVSGTLVTMLLCGLWHGASWTFIAWGAIHAFYLASSQATRKLRGAARHALGIRKRSALWKGVRVAVTFSLLCVSWIFFRSSSLSDAWHVVAEILGGEILSLRTLEVFGIGRGAGLDRTADFLLALASVGGMFVLPAVARAGRLLQQPLWIRWLAYGSLALWVVMSATESGSSFLYARY